ncbi:hypothetical protein BGZ65_000331 [Modicella reniformis]|uniref:Uncharacterized protein n=1 Tax=Modicella reniformis TaxID=1440133 RepID=A0A9P6M0E4_9FUNG|nr:hypothetical protein BGZ65_000331 [Modicella reniformis]
MTDTMISFHKKRLPRLIVSDLDGTLLTPQHTISRRSIDALAFAQGFYHGNNNNNNNDDHHLPIQIMIASGRSPRSIQKVIDLFDGLMIPDAVLCCNGALNYNPRTKAISYPQFIPLDQALFMVQGLRTEISGHGTIKSQIPINKNQIQQDSIMEEDLIPLNVLDGQRNDNDGDDDPLIAGRPGFACEVIWFEGVLPSGEPIYAQDTSFVCDKTWELQRKHTFYYDYSVVDDTMEAFLQSLQQAAAVDGRTGRSGGIIKLLALDRNRTAPEVFESLPVTLRSASTSSTTSETKETRSSPMEVTYSGDYFLEIAAPRVSKGLGLAKYCGAHNISREEVVAFGDLLNDAEMLQFAGLGLCMGNGHEDMKKLADRVIGTNAEDGLAKEIESWFM